MSSFILALWLAGSIAAAPVIEAPAAAIDMRVAALLMSDQQGGPLPIAVAVARRSDGVTPRATISIELDGASLLDALATAEAGEAPVAEIFVYVVGKRFDVLDAVTLAVTLEPDDGPALGATGLRAVTELPLPDGDATVRVLARLGGRFGLRGRPLPPLTGTPSLLEPRFPSSEPWIVAHSEQASPTEPLDALPVLAIGTPIEPAFDRHGEIDGAVSLRLVAIGSSDPGVDIPYGAPLPPIEPGRYRGRLVLQAADETIEPSAPVDLLVVDGSAYAVPWPRLARLSQGTPDIEEGGEVLLPDDLREALDVLERGWLQMLVDLPETGFADAVVAIRRLEVEARETFGPQGRRAFGRVRAEVFDDLARQLRRDDAGPRALLPLAILDLERERAHAAAGRHSLAHRALDDALVVARRIAKDANDDVPELRRQLTTIFGWTADRLQRRGFVDAAEALFREALAIDPNDHLLRFGLFANLVRHGRPGDAVDELAAAGTSIDGVSTREVRLRRAIAERRAERYAAAEASLRSLVGTGDDWIAHVATQEMVTLHLDRRRFDQATDVARRGLQRLGDEPGLRVLLARALTRRGRLDAARDALLAIEPSPSRANPRTQVNAWPTDAIDTRGQELLDAAADRTEALAAAARRLLEDSGS